MVNLPGEDVDGPVRSGAESGPVLGVRPGKVKVAQTGDDQSYGGGGVD